jgi:alpha-galactosidase/6-phospho-beta-glucosidase family protein
VFGVFTYPSDDHIGEYLAFAADGRLPADDPRIQKRSEEIAVPVICDILLDRGIPRPSVNALNESGYIPNMPRDVIVGVPVRADARGIHPQTVDPISEPWAAFTRTQYAIYGLLTGAYRTRSRKLLPHALLLDPCVDSITRAQQLLDWMLEKQAAYLPTFA